jgi:hypothetical protein
MWLFLDNNCCVLDEKALMTTAAKAAADKRLTVIFGL